MNAMPVLKDLKVGDFVGMVEAPRLACPIPQGDPSWHIILAAPNSEETARHGLLDLGIRAYAPVVRKFVASAQRHGNGQRKMVERTSAMFPGYLLADVREGFHDYTKIEKVKGGRKPGFLRFVVGEKAVPCVLPAALVEAIRERELAEDRLFQDKLAGRTRAPFEPGEGVRIVDGPFRGFFAQVERLDDKGRVQLLLEMFNGKRLTWLKGSQLDKV